MSLPHLSRLARPLLAASGVLLASQAMSAQTTRVEVIAERQAEKAATLGEEGPSRAEELVVRVGSALLGGPPEGVYPWLGSVYDGAGPALGVGYRRPFSEHSAVSVRAGWSTSGSTLLEVRTDLPSVWDGRLTASATARRVDARQLAFYGLGPDSSRDQRMRFDSRPTTAGVDISLRPVWPIVVGAGYDHLRLEGRSEEVRLAGLTHDQAPGLGEPLRYGVARLSAALDWRPSPGYSTRGGFVRGSWTRHDERTGRPYAFDTREVEAGQLVPLIREHYVLAFRGLATFTDARDGHDVPIMLAPYLGSGSTLRGFRNRRFMDGSRLLLTGEFRWRPSRYLDMALFADAGQVAPHSDRFRWGAFETTAGIGGRFHGPTFSALRFDLARGREGWALAISAAQPF